MPDDWPFMGSVVAAKLRSQGDLPGAITLPHMPSRAPYTRPGQFAARLGVEHDPLYVNGDFDKPLSFKAPALVLHGDVNVERLKARRGLLQTIDDARRELDATAGVEKWSQLQDASVLAAQLLANQRRFRGRRRAASTA